MSDEPNFGEKQFSGAGFPTPLSIPEDTVCRTLKIPADGSWEAVVMGALWALALPYSWQQFEGGIDREDAAARAQAMIEQAYDEVDFGCPVTTVDTPYWDDEIDVDDELPDDEQPWYGYVAAASPETAILAADTEELDFVEDATIWAFTGLIALSLGLPGILPALAFRTAARNFVLSYKNDHLGSIIRFFVDGYKIYQGVDTGGGEITDVPVIVDPDTEDHQVYATGDDSISIVRKKLTPNEITPPGTRYNSDCDCVQVTPDDGTTWNDAPGLDPRSAPGFQRPPRTSSDPQCDAAANMVALVRSTIDSVAGASNVFSLSSILLDAWLLAMTGIGVLVALIVLFCEAVASVGFVVVSEAFTEDVYDQLLCTFFCNMAEDGSVDSDQLDAIYADIAANYDAVVILTMGAMLNAWGFVGLTNAGAIGSETGDCSECECGPWCHRWTIAELLASGSWSYYQNDTYSQYFQTSATMTLIRIEFGWTWNGMDGGGDGSPGSSGAKAFYDGLTTLELNNPLVTAESPFVWEGLQAMTYLLFGLNGLTDSGGAVVDIEYVQLSGIDDPPDWLGGTDCS